MLVYASYQTTYTVPDLSTSAVRSAISARMLTLGTAKELGSGSWKSTSETRTGALQLAPLSVDMKAEMVNAKKRFIARNHHRTNHRFERLD